MPKYYYGVVNSLGSRIAFVRNIGALCAIPPAKHSDLKAEPAYRVVSFDRKYGLVIPRGISSNTNVRVFIRLYTGSGHRLVKFPSMALQFRWLLSGK